jgi:hypothetical protein
MGLCCWLQALQLVKQWGPLGRLAAKGLYFIAQVCGEGQLLHTPAAAHAPRQWQ